MIEHKSQVSLFTTGATVKIRIINLRMKQGITQNKFLPPQG